MEPIKLYTVNDGPIAAQGERWSPDAKNHVTITQWRDMGGFTQTRQTVTLRAVVECPAEHAQAMADWLESLAPSPEAVAEKLWELRTGCRIERIQWSGNTEDFSVVRNIDCLGTYGTINGQAHWAAALGELQFADSLPAAKAALLAHLGLT